MNFFFKLKQNTIEIWIIIWNNIKKKKKNKKLCINKSVLILYKYQVYNNDQNLFFNNYILHNHIINSNIFHKF